MLWRRRSGCFVHHAEEMHTSMTSLLLGPYHLFCQIRILKKPTCPHIYTTASDEVSSAQVPISRHTFPFPISHSRVDYMHA